MIKNKILVVSDNEPVLRFFIDLIEEKQLAKDGRSFDFACAPWNKSLTGLEIGSYSIKAFDVKKNYNEIIKNYDLVISAHCKQLFPEPMTRGVKCINIHPGLNPFNRGWYPQVFSIINGLPLGATIHEIDEEIDHGAIVDQIEVRINSYDTSLDAYSKVIDAEKVILERSIESILNDTYEARPPKAEGNLNLKADFDALCEINLDEKVTFREAINKLRALTHGDYKNAYFYDEKTKQKIWVSVELEVQE